MEGKAVFMVRAKVEDAVDRKAFDLWYRDEHLPDAVRAFEADRGWRAWSRADPSVHYAFYEFENVARLEAGTRPEVVKELVAEFDRVWGDRVTRSRDALEIVGSLGD